jgi:hypothetical protein
MLGESMGEKGSGNSEEATESPSDRAGGELALEEGCARRCG